MRQLANRLARFLALYVAIVGLTVGLLGAGAHVAEATGPGKIEAVCRGLLEHMTITSGGTYTTPVAGPASSTDNAIPRFSGTTGKLIENTIVTIDDNAFVLGTGFGVSTGDGGIMRESGRGLKCTLYSDPNDERTLEGSGFLLLESDPDVLAGQTGVFSRAANTIALGVNGTGEFEVAANVLRLPTGAAIEWLTGALGTGNGNVGIYKLDADTVGVYDSLDVPTDLAVGGVFSTARQVYEVHGSDDTLGAAESDSAHANSGAATRTITLPTVAVSGVTFHFASLVSGQVLRIDPGADEKLIGVFGGGFGDGEYAELAFGAAMSITSQADGDWTVVAARGRITEQTGDVGHLSGGQVTPWAAYTPTSVTWTTNTATSFVSRRVGDMLHVRMSLLCSGAPDTATLQVVLAQTVDEAKLPVGTWTSVQVGTGFALDTTVHPLVVIYDVTNNLLLFRAQATATDNDLLVVTEAVPWTFGSGDGMQCEFSVPVSGW